MYAYQWSDHARVILLLIETFYDKQKGDRSNPPVLWQSVPKSSYWDERFRAVLGLQQKDEDVFVEKDGIVYINWMKAIGNIIWCPRPLLRMREALGRVMSLIRRPYVFVMYIISSISIGVGYCLGLAEQVILVCVFLVLTLSYALLEWKMYCLYGRYVALMH